MKRAIVLTMLGAVAVAAVVVMAAGAKSSDNGLQKINHIVVIYEENHSFDNLYGGWEGVNGRANATAAETTQVNQAGTPYTCLLQLDVNLTGVSIPPCTGPSGFPNNLFDIGSYIPASAQTCPQPGGFFPNGSLPNAANLPGGCTRDIVHRFYQEQYQLNNGKQNRYTTGSDAAGLTQGYFDTQSLPIYQYLHSGGHPHYAIADDFFQGAFGGSFLNHQWLISAHAPVWANPSPVNDGSSNDFHSILDANGFPNSSYPLYHPATTVKDSMLTQQCGLTTTVAGFACGDFAVNTTQPWYQPYAPGTGDSRRLPPLHTANIGDELSSVGVSWAWYSGGWSNADGDVGAPGWTNGDGTGTVCSDPNTATGALPPTPAHPTSTNTYPNCPNAVFQFHHQAFNYFYNYRPGTKARQDHLGDEVAFQNLVASSSKDCNLDSVSFVKPIGLENEHPGYTSETEGSNHLVSLLKAIDGSKCAKDTMVVVTYDEFGGQFDHVAPPGQGGTQGPHDQWGPGTRVPTLIVAPGLRGEFVVDHTQYDTTSILTTIEQRFGVAALGTRDAAVNSLANVFDAKQVEANQ